ncbi:Type II secretion system protein J [Gammaproteobacteria bacterium]
MVASQKTKGFTLLELLLAISIFAVLSALAYGGLNTVLKTSHYVSIQVDRLLEVQAAVTILSRDFAQVVDRSPRDEYGDPRVSFLGGGLRGGSTVEFTRGGWRNPGGFTRSSLQRIGYTVQGNWLIRLSWQVLDRAQDSVLLQQPILDQVKSVKFRFLENEVWREQWPPEEIPAPGTPKKIFPRAVEVILELYDFGVVSRLYPLPSVFRIEPTVPAPPIPPS